MSSLLQAGGLLRVPKLVAAVLDVEDIAVVQESVKNGSCKHLVAYQGRPVMDVGSFRNRVSLTLPGSREQLTIIRDGKHHGITVTIGKLTEDKLIAKGPAQSTDELGLTVQMLTPQLAEQFDAKAGEGVVVTEVEPGSIAAMAGIEPGAVIVQVNRKPVKSAAEFKRAVEKSSGDKRVLLLLCKGDMQQYLVLRW